MKNTKQNTNNTEDSNSLSERQDEARNERSECSCPQSSGSPLTAEEAEYLLNFPKEIEEQFFSKLENAMDLPSGHFDKKFKKWAEENPEEVKKNQERLDQLRERLEQGLLS